MSYTRHTHNSFEVHSPQYRHHVLDLQHLILDFFIQMRRRAIAKTHNKNETIHHMWHTRHINNSLEMHPLQYCPHVLDLHVRRRSIADFTATSKYCHHVLDLQHLILDFFMKMRRRAIATFTTQTKPYTTCGTQYI